MTCMFQLLKTQLKLHTYPTYLKYNKLFDKSQGEKNDLEKKSEKLYLHQKAKQNNRYYIER